MINTKPDLLHVTPSKYRATKHHNLILTFDGLCQRDNPSATLKGLNTCMRVGRRATRPPQLRRSQADTWL